MQKNRIHSSWLIISICVILAAGFVLTSVLSYISTRNYILQSDATETLPLLNDNLYSMMEKDLFSPINVSSLMANDTFLINWVLSGEEDQNEVSEYLAYINQKYDFTSAFFVSDITHHYYYYNGILKEISLSDAHDSWYYEFKALNKPYDLDVDTDEAKLGKLTVFINHRLETQTGEFLGVTGVGIELAQVGEQLESYQELFDHKIYLVDAEGLVQIHSDERLVMTAYIQDVLGADESDAFVLVENDAVNIFEINADTGTKVVSTRFLPDLEWYLVIEKDESASLKLAVDALWKNISIGLAITVLISGIIVGLIKTYNKRIEYLASFDELTGVLNRRAFLQMLKREMSIAQRYQRPLAVMMIDVDDFKVVNDQLGHMAGDEVLRKITAQLKESLRDSDVVGRWGGDEFIAVALNTDQEKLLKSTQRLLHTVQSNTIQIGETSLESTVSIGYCLFAGLEDMEAEKLIQKADEALLRAKNKGRNQASG